MAEESIHDQLNKISRHLWAIRNGQGGTAITLSFELGGAFSVGLHTLRGFGEWECECKKLANEKGCVQAIIEDTIFEGHHFFSIVRRIILITGSIAITMAENLKPNASFSGRFFISPATALFLRNIPQALWIGPFVTTHCYHA